MRVEQIMDALSGIDPEYIREAEQWTPVKKRRLPSRLSVAACLILVMAGSFIALSSVKTDRNNAGAAGAPELNSGSDTDSAESILSEGSQAFGPGSLEKAAQPENAAEEKEAVPEMETRASIIFNEVSGITSASYNTAEAEQLAYVNASELEEYFNVTIFPAWLPDGLSMQEPARGYSIAYGSSRSVLNDNNMLVYRDASGTRELCVSVRTVEAGEVLSFAETGLKSTVIDGTELTAGHYKADQQQEDCYLAVFRKENVDFTIQAKNLTRDEVENVLYSMLD